MMRSVRTPEELKFAAVLQVADQAEKGLPIGPAERKTGPLDFLKEGYIGVIIDSLTVDGWVVIGILAIMSAVSCWVMFSKLSYLNNAIKANQVFLRAWSHLSRDLTGLEDENGGLNAKLDPRGKKLMRNSPLYHVYHTGVEEIRHRLKDESGKEGGDAMDKDGGLSGRSIEAIRASMDGTLIRENEKLTSNMVLLTIAISGGPFLGLLGTVVGVMITFAAVAQAGDVNVNAIAPGIAAALAATVAGLAVAIPALFGYNYLLTRIKATTNDLHVFIDEFVTKLAEFHAEETEEVE
jgi:biopolymer transport protein ExbB